MPVEFWATQAENEGRLLYGGIAISDACQSLISTAGFGARFYNRRRYLKVACGRIGDPHGGIARYTDAP